MKKNINIAHESNNFVNTNDIRRLVNETYKKTVTKILDKSELSVTEKKEILNKIIDNNKRTN